MISEIHVFEIECDARNCGMTFRGEETQDEEETKQAARREGWSFVDGDFCRDHVHLVGKQ